MTIWSLTLVSVIQRMGSLLNLTTLLLEQVIGEQQYGWASNFKADHCLLSILYAYHISWQKCWEESAFSANWWTCLECNILKEASLLHGVFSGWKRTSHGYAIYLIQKSISSHYLNVFKRVVHWALTSSLQMVVQIKGGGVQRKKNCICICILNF